ncbi:SCO7613 C-terminal domain-containing membrane protein [Glycomyces tritici]|uniref:Permease n=1 Tax=Glycomyces tritici TaxID=2665176 RepID=A0ABT7YMB8_9ACTN|nr:hypothetical protein [Glycomyces tritici]MDN3239784.1 hypothetical protein [Glycomyces tritici]
MNTYNCPRCGGASTADRCPACGRGPEPLLARLGQLDAVLAAMPSTLQSRAAVEAERVDVLKGLTELAARYLAEAESRARTAPTPQTPGVPAPTPVGATAPQGPATPPSGAPQVPPPPLPPYPQPHTPPGGAIRPPRDRGEVGSKTVQTVLLSLGGLLVAAALIIFTAVAWRNMGNSGRAGVLGGVTLLLLAVPFAFKRFRLWATAETFGALAALALWCTTLAGYYLYRPPGTAFGPETVAAWTAGVLVVLAAYRAVACLTATSWAVLPLAAIGLAYAAASDLALAVTLMLALALALGATAWITAKRPSHYARSDVWASRFLTCAAVIAACSAGLRAAFGLADPVVPPVAAAVALLAAANLIGVHLARRLGVSLTTMLVAASASGSLVLCAWVLSIRAGTPELLIPSLALAAAAILPFALLSRKSPWPLASAATAGLVSLAAFAIVTFDAPDLSAYFVAFLAARLISPAVAAPLGKPLRIASYLVGGGTAVVAALTALAGIYPLIAYEPGWGINREVPIVLAALAIAAILLPSRFRVNAAALAVSLAIESAAVLIWTEDPTRFDPLPTIALMLCALIGLTSALASGTVAGRCTGWSSLALWVLLTSLAAGNSDTMSPEQDSWIPFWLTVAAASMLVIAAGAPRRTRADRVLAAVLAHILAGISALVGLIASVSFGSEGLEFFPAAQFGVYTLALIGVAIMAPVRTWGYAIAALCTGTVGWWLMLAAAQIDVFECYTAPPAAILFLIGLWRLERRPEAGSWSTLALPILIGIGPSLILALDDGDELRRVGVGAAAIAVIIAGLVRRWQAPLVLGSIVLAVMVVNELLLLRGSIPVWIPPAIGGAVLITVGATFERRRRDLRRIRDGLKSMR